MVNLLVRKTSIILQDVIVLGARGNGDLLRDRLCQSQSFLLRVYRPHDRPGPMSRQGTYQELGEVLVGDVG